MYLAILTTFVAYARMVADLLTEVLILERDTHNRLKQSYLIFRLAGRMATLFGIPGLYSEVNFAWLLWLLCLPSYEEEIISFLFYPVLAWYCEEYKTSMFDAIHP